MKTDPYASPTPEASTNEALTAHYKSGMIQPILDFYEKHGNMILIALYVAISLLTQVSDIYWALDHLVKGYDKMNNGHRLGFFSGSVFDFILLWCSIKCFYLIILERSEEKKVLAYGLAYWLVVFYALAHFRDQISEESSRTYLEQKAKFYLEEGLLKAAEFLVVLRFIRERSQVLKKKYRPYTKWNMAYDFSFGLIGVKHQPRKLDLDPRGQTTIPSLNPDIRLSQESQ